METLCLFSVQSDSVSEIFKRYIWFYSENTSFGLLVVIYGGFTRVCVCMYVCVGGSDLHL